MAYAPPPAAPAPVGPAYPQAQGGRASLLNQMTSEWTKIRTLRSNYWNLGIMVVLSVGFAILLSSLLSGKSADVTAIASVVALMVFVLVSPILTTLSGVMIVTSEYSHGMIRTTLTAQPRRIQVYLGKLIVYTLVTLVVALVTAGLSYLIGSSVASGSNVTQGWSPGEAIFAGALYVTVLGMMSFGLAAIIRNTAGSIMSAIGLLLVLPYVVLPIVQSATNHAAWAQDLNKWLPASYDTGIEMLAGHQAGFNLFSPWIQFLVSAVWALAALILGGYLLATRDA